MEGVAYWIHYLKKINLGVQLPINGSIATKKTFQLPEDFNQWCKGNVNNGKVLLISIIREILHQHELNFQLSTNFGTHIFPIDVNGYGDFRLGAKSLLSEVKSHSEHLSEAPTVTFAGIFISDLNPDQITQHPLCFYLSPDLNSVTLTYLESLEHFSLLLMENVIDTIHSGQLNTKRTDLKSIGEDLQQTEISNQIRRKEIITYAWEAVFEQKIEWDKNYHSNGGDSIQAIRFLSKMKEQGAEVDLVGLFNAFSFSHWIFNHSKNNKQHTDFSSQPTVFPLTEMQNKIWNHHLAFKEHGAYHEQFLFQLNLAPSITEIETCINAIWKSYPNIRIQIQENGSQLLQRTIHSDLTVQELHYKSCAEALIEDRKDEFDQALLRLKILYIEKKTYLLWSHHHLILDGWSVGILIHEFIERISTKNYEPTIHPNYQYQLHCFENEFPAIKQNSGNTPIIFPINDYNKQQSFQSIQFKKLAIDLAKEELLINEFQITKQLLFCGISGLLLCSVFNKSNFYFNGISSGRDFLEGEIDQAVGLFIRNIQIPILLDESTTWHSFFNGLNANFQQVLATKNRNEANDDTVTNSDFLFVYENYPYTELKSAVIQAELIHVNEVTGYPITFCLFPNPDGYALRIVYDARRFDEDFINGLKIKFEQTFNHIVNTLSQGFILKNKKVNYPSFDALAIDAFTKDDLNELKDQSLKIGFIEGQGWKELFDDAHLFKDTKQFDAMLFWETQLFSHLPGHWNDLFVKVKKLELKQSITTNLDQNLILGTFVKFLKLHCWDGNAFQINVQKNQIIFPLNLFDIEDDELDDLIQQQLQKTREYHQEFLALFEKQWLPTANFLVSFEDEIPHDKWNKFDFVLQLTSGTVGVYSNERISKSFMDNCISNLSKPKSTGNADQLSYLSIKHSQIIKEQSFKTLVENQVAKFPDRMAVDDGELKMTYEELDNYSNQLARFFVDQFNLSDSHYIGIKLKRSTHQLACILALIKLGKAFIPLDLNWPEHRLNQIIEQAKLQIIIDETTLKEVQLDHFSKVGLKLPDFPMEATFYSLFTSGSTGKPKGCVISEAAFLNYLEHCKNTYFHEQSKLNIHVFTPLSFDFTLTSMLGGIAFGYQVILHSEKENVYDSLAIALKDEQSSVLKLTPSHISLAEKEWFSSATSKTLIVGGEALTEIQVAKCLEGNTHQLINEYGPTEATVGCVFQEVKLNEIPLIGLPINGMGVMILDENDKLVTKGREGELCLFGNGLADGYLNDEIRTNQSFHYWKDNAAFRLYRTGDLAKMQQDGRIQFISRKDSQIKLNGYRIETDEISFAVREICGLNSQIIVSEHGSSKQLLIYVEGQISSINLLEELKKWLPSYMVPSRLIELDKFPVTANGKLDFHKLTLLDQNKIEQNENVRIQEIVNDYKKLNEDYQSILSYASLEKNGWAHFQKQIHLLLQIQTSHVPILIPQSLQHHVPIVISRLDESKLAKGIPSLLCKETSFSIDQLTEYAQHIDGLGKKLPNLCFSLFSRTINQLLNLSPKEEIIQIKSQDIPFIKVNETVVIEDWSRECGFPICLVKNKLGDLICLLPSTFTNNIIDTFGLNQPADWEGQLSFLKTGSFSFKYSHEQLILNRKDTIQRFSNSINLTFLEKHVHKINQDIECAFAKESEGKIHIYIQTQSSISLDEISTALSKDLPPWLQIEKFIQTQNIAEISASKSDLTIQKESSSFTNFLESHLPEYGYLNGSQSLIEQGGDSITALRIVGKLKTKGFEIEVGSLLNAANISDYLLNLTLANSTEIKSNELELTPIQEWFLTQYPGNKNHFNQSILLEILMGINPSVLFSVLETTLANQSILSQVFVDSWRKGLKPRVQHIQCETTEEVTKYCAEVQESFDLKIGPVACGAVIEVEGKLLLFLSMHHLYCDGYTWRIILDDIQEVLQGRGIKRESSLVYGKIRNQFQDIYIKKKKESTAFFGNQIQNPFSDWNPYSYKVSNYLEWEWSVEQTKWFQYTTDIGTTANEKFLFLFLNTWIQLNYEPSTIFFETHGRFYEGIPELTETIGWFTQFYPLFCKSWPNLETLQNEISSQFKDLPENGLTYMANETWFKPPFPVLLNYLGNFDENRGAIAIPSNISQGNMTSLENPVLGMVEMNALIVEGKMKWMLRMHPNMDPSIFKDQLNDSLNGLMNTENKSNFIAQSIDQDDLDAINNLLGGL
jgi:amino acid adenylation domain-containing protein